MSGKPTLTATGYAVQDAKVEPSKGATDYYVRVFCRLSVEDKPDGGERPNAWFVDAVVFGRDRERAAGVGKGDAVAFMGSLSRQRRRYGNEREVWSCLCDAFSTSAANSDPAKVPEPEVPEPEVEDDEITTLLGIDRRHEAEVVADLTGGEAAPLDEITEDEVVAALTWVPELHAPLDETTEDEPAPDEYPSDPPAEHEVWRDQLPEDDDNIVPPSMDRRHKLKSPADLTDDDIPF